MPDRAVAPFARGRTFFHGKTVDSADLPGTSIMGQVHVFQDTDPSDEAKHRSNGDVVAVAVRNVSGAALLPKTLVQYKTDAIGKEVDGNANSYSQLVAGVVDDHLPTAGCPDDDICWIIVKGPCIVKSAYINMGKLVAINDAVHAHTADSSLKGATESGRFTCNAAAAATGASALLVNQNVIGRAITALTIGQTNYDTLIDLSIK